MIFLLGEWPNEISIKASCAVDTLAEELLSACSSETKKKKHVHDNVSSFSISLHSYLSETPGRLDLLSDTSFFKNHSGLEGLFQKCVFRSIYAPSCIKKKEFQLSFEVDLSFCGIESAESFTSNDIKVISKPLKKSTSRSLDCNMNI